MEQEPPIVPGGETPESVFIAVGHALTCWEQMESNLAYLYTVFAGQPGSVGALSTFGKDNKSFETRMRALSRAAETYFQAAPDQSREGAFSTLLKRVLELAIERHRIAHGILFPIGLGGEDVGDDVIEFGGETRYILGTPWYALESLRNSLMGQSPAQIDWKAAKFLKLSDDIDSYISAIAPHSSPRKPPAPKLRIKIDPKDREGLQIQVRSRTDQ